MRGAMGSIEPRQRLSVSIEDIYKRRLQRSKAKDDEKPFHIHIQDRSSNCKFPLLKLVLVIIICGTFVTLLYSPEVYTNDHLSHKRSRDLYKISTKQVPPLTYMCTINSYAKGQVDSVYCQAEKFRTYFIVLNEAEAQLHTTPCHAPRIDSRKLRNGAENYLEIL
ncbi:hypothetical protein L1049_019857 [Liquidambar formosana]|uniref:Uncharacterized protein n=1 Tax=Liquidambar formosana TaxID=63359 RepID=A0AAP0S718_LIQFO